MPTLSFIILTMAAEAGMVDRLRHDLAHRAGRERRDLECEISHYVHQTLFSDDQKTRDALENFVLLARLTLPPFTDFNLPTESTF